MDHVLNVGFQIHDRENVAAVPAGFRQASLERLGVRNSERLRVDVDGLQKPQKALYIILAVHEHIINTASVVLREFHNRRRVLICARTGNYF